MTERYTPEVREELIRIIALIAMTPKKSMVERVQEWSPEPTND